ncbi:MAG TPA: class II fructose-bisphosphate aldolase [Geobacteraceae bacterium]|nr:class II fructose-bisphosphate aldolase [Geobacteraceae bacterium]
MNKSLQELVPVRIREKLGSKSAVTLLNGKDVFSALQHEKLIIMACNARIKHVIPGIMRAAEELDAVVAFELTRSEGGLDGGYTGQTPEIFVNTLFDYAEQVKYSKPFIIHGDHITVRNTTTEELEAAEKLLLTQIAAGFTSFAIDASFNPLQENIRIVNVLARHVMAEGYGLEVELGEIKPVGSDSTPTSVAETEEFLEGLAACGVNPLLLSINNGSKSGNYLDGQKINIDLAVTMEIYRAAHAFGVAGLVQHGITGTPLHIVGKLADYGIRKGNIGTLWQNIAHAGLPLNLMDTMRLWTRQNRRDIKYSTKIFKAEIDAIPEEDALQIHEMAYREAKEFLTAFRAKGSASRLADLLEDSGCA